MSNYKRRIALAGFATALCLAVSFGICGCSLLSGNPSAEQSSRQIADAGALVQELLSDPFPSLEGREARYYETAFHEQSEIAFSYLGKEYRMKASACLETKGSLDSRVAYNKAEVSNELEDRIGSGIMETYAIFDESGEVTDEYASLSIVLSEHGEEKRTSKGWTRGTDGFEDEASGFEQTNLPNRGDLITPLQSLPDIIRESVISEAGSNYIISGKMQSNNIFGQFMSTVMCANNYVAAHDDNLMLDVRLTYDKATKQLTRMDMSYDGESLGKIEKELPSLINAPDDCQFIELAAYCTFDKVAPSGDLTIPADVINTALSQQG